jgi:hypothetical protein
MKYVFIVGYPRSGTTLLADMLGRVTGFAVTPESRFYEENKYFWSSKKSNIVDNLNRKTRLKDFFEDYSGVLDGETLTRGQVLKQILAQFAYHNSVGEGVVEKSPIHVFHVNKIRRDFPGSRIFSIVRDPYFAINSWQNTPWRKRSNIWLQLEWNYRNNIIKNNSNINEVVRYEDLLAEPVSVLRELMVATVGIENEDIINKAIISDRESTAVPEWEQQWKNNVNGPLLINKQGHGNSLSMRYINPNLALFFGYDQYKRSFLKSLLLNLLSSMTVGGYRLARHLFYQLGINILFKRPSDGEGSIS